MTPNPGSINYFIGLGSMDATQVYGRGVANRHLLAERAGERTYFEEFKEESALLR
jgi:hypothetical protein